MQKFDVICFDLGGVLLDISGVNDILGWLGNKQTLPEFWLKWLHSPAVKAFEAGLSSENEFIARVVKEFELPINEAEFEQSYRYWIKGVFNGTFALLSKLQKDYKLVCLSNTNTIHWPEVEATGILDFMQTAYVSFQMQAVKPDATIYQKMLADLNVPPERVLFFDDNQINVDAAIDCGIESYRVVGEGALENQLHALKLI
ncbi:HAD family hydrolase [Catenovulum sediminis]|uniref:HAD-IA family hydrolase n=1 Tax=Catenovulum sediminis TaxID=1740262 RepID=A0ABV1RDQ2_9ALTE